MSVSSNRGAVGPLVVASNTVGGSVSVANNSITTPMASFMTVVFNSVTGAMTCQNNSAVRFIGSFNTARVFAGQCSA